MTPTFNNRSIRFNIAIVLASALSIVAGNPLKRAHAAVSDRGALAGFLTAHAMPAAPNADSTVGRIDTNVVQQRLRYPAGELEAGRSGNAYGEIVVSRSGFVTVVDVVGNVPPFAQALRAALTGVQGNAALRSGPDNAATYSVMARFTAVASKGDGQDAKFVGVMTVGVGGPNAVTILDSPNPSNNSGLSATPEPVEAEQYPEPDVFMMVESDATYDQADLMRRLQYPEVARRNGIEGNVVVQALVDKHGVVQQTRITASDNNALDEAAIAAVKGTTFVPARQNKMPVAIWTQVPVRFSMSK